MRLKKAKINLEAPKGGRKKTLDPDKFEVINGVRMRKDRNRNYMELDRKNRVTEIRGESEHVVNDVIGE